MHSKRQTVLAVGLAGDVRSLDLPAPEDHVLPGVVWGRFEQFFTPAFWASRSWMASLRGWAANYRLGTTLVEELAACLLGGHGIPAEVGVAAFRHLVASGALAGEPTAEQLEALLRGPLYVRNKVQRYRFASQKARFLAAGIKALRTDLSQDTATDDISLRTFLMDLPGIGPKTASWITRNWLNSDRVAILDIHICRACTAAGVFPEQPKLATRYLELEARFLEFAAGMALAPSILDNVMWQTMRGMGHLLPANLARTSSRTHRRRSRLMR